MIVLIESTIDYTKDGEKRTKNQNIFKDYITFFCLSRCKFFSQHIFSPYIQVYNYKHTRGYNHLF